MLIDDKLHMSLNEGANEREKSASMVDISSIIEGTVKFRDGKKVNFLFIKVLNLDF